MLASVNSSVLACGRRCQLLWALWVSQAWAHRLAADMQRRDWYVAKSHLQIILCVILVVQGKKIYIYVCAYISYSFSSFSLFFFRFLYPSSSSRAFLHFFFVSSFILFLLVFLLYFWKNDLHFFALSPLYLVSLL